MTTREIIKGPIAWMTRNHVAANLLMIFIIGGGIMFSFQVKQEVFPEVALDKISVSVPYPGASPAEVEQGILLPIEEGVRGLDGVKKVTSRAAEGSGSVTIDLFYDADNNKLLQDVKNAVDRIVTFPEDAERPIVSLLTNRNSVLSVVVYGNHDELVIRRLASRLREMMLAHPGITLAELSGTRALEISVEIPESNLRAHNLTLRQVADKIRYSALEVPGGGVKGKGGETLLRMDERCDQGKEFAQIPLLSRPDGTQLKVGDIGRVIDGLADVDQATFFNGKCAARVTAYRVGGQTPTEVSKAAYAVLEDFKQELAPGIGAMVWDDQSEIFQDRMSLLFRNASLGLILVMVILGLFMEIRLAFWVTLGIPISFLGAFLIMPAMDVSINMISLFAFIITLGIVVDDAVVVGENVYEMRERGMSPLQAAIFGAKQIAVPVAFAILTNIAAFMPMFFVSGMMGKFFRVIPAIVVSVFIISWVESLFILPAHLGHQKKIKRWGLGVLIGFVQDRFSHGLQWAIKRVYQPTLERLLGLRYMTVAFGLTILIIAVGLVVGKRISFIFMPRVESDKVMANATLPYGSPFLQIKEVQKKLVHAANLAVKDCGEADIVKGIYSTVGSGISFTPHRGEGAKVETNKTGVMVSLVPAGERTVGSAEFEDRWRQRVGEIAGVDSLSFISTAGPGSADAPLDFQLNHGEIEVLHQAAAELAQELKDIEGVIDVNKGFQPGKPQFNYRIQPEASSLGLTAGYVGRQLRDSFYGAEALRQQRGRDEIRVYVRLPEAERRSEYHLEQMLVRTATGGEIPLSEITETNKDRAYTEIKRSRGKRSVSVTGYIAPRTTTSDEVIPLVKKTMLPPLLARYPGLSYTLEGRQREREESIGSLQRGFLLAMLAIFAMLAIPFRSYIQPLIIMGAIPFGVLGAILGHMVMGYNLSLISIMGIVALSGVVVNDSLVLVHAVNRYRFEEGEPLIQALVRGGCRRFRPIILTSLTTFFGLAPMIFETSMQARFLIPMAISLGFGILFATVIVLCLVPCLYLISEDVTHLARKLMGKGEMAGSKHDREDFSGSK